MKATDRNNSPFRHTSAEFSVLSFTAPECRLVTNTSISNRGGKLVTDHLIVIPFEAKLRLVEVDYLLLNALGITKKPDHPVTLNLSLTVDGKIHSSGTYSSSADCLLTRVIRQEYQIAHTLRDVNDFTILYEAVQSATQSPRSIDQANAAMLREFLEVSFPKEVRCSQERMISKKREIFGAAPGDLMHLRFPCVRGDDHLHEGN